MTTAIAVYNSDGCVGRCDAKCHSAKSAGCNCICGGKNHGLGLANAIENNHKRIGLTREDLARFGEQHELDASTLTVVDRLACPSRKRARTMARKQLEQPVLF